MTSRSRRLCVAVIAAFVVTVFSGALSSAASAAVEGPGWALTGRTYPTNVAPGGQGMVLLDVFNVGAAASAGTITITDTLPEGVTATKAGEKLQANTGGEPVTGNELWVCTGNGSGTAPRVRGATVVTCVNNPEKLPSLAGGGGHPNTPRDITNREPELAIGISVSANARGAAVAR